MKRLVWILVIAAAGWAGNEVRTKGIEGAFGGVLAGRLDPIDSQGVSPDDGAYAQ
jgi:hypothetical protein